MFKKFSLGQSMKNILTYLIHFGWTNTEFCQKYVPNTSHPQLSSSTLSFQLHYGGADLALNR